MTHPHDPNRFFDRRTSRRSFLRGAAAATLGAGAFAVLGQRPASGFDFTSVPAPVTITDVAPADGGVYLTERVGARRADLEDTWRPTGHVWLHNHGGSPVTLERMRVVYLGGTPPEMVEIETPYWKQDAQPVINPGKTRSFPVAEPREHAFPSAGMIELQCFFVGYGSPVTAQYPMALYQNLQPGGAYYFPARAEDLPEGHYWSLRGNHGYGSNHGHSLTQRFAYDFGVSRYNGSKWTRLRPGTDGSKNEDFLIWGTPVYAMAAGKIIAGYRDVDDNPEPGVKGSAGGNRLYIQHEAGDASDGGFVLYAHLMKGTIPSKLVPQEGMPGPNVVRGEFLGLVGNSGQSGGPHLHLHYQRGLHKYAPGAHNDYRDGRPLLFRDIRIREYDDFDPTAGETGWYAPPHGVAVGERMLIDAQEGPPYPGPFELHPALRGNNNFAAHANDDPAALEEARRDRRR